MSPPSLATRDLGGEGATFVIVHGFTGSSRDFAPVAPSLVDLRRVVLVDQLGHGDSPRVAEYSYDLLAEALTAAIERLPGPVDLLGHSLGGRVVLSVAIERPDLVRSLVVMNGWADAPDRGEAGRQLADALADGIEPSDALAGFEVAREDPEAELLVAQCGRERHEARLEENAAQLDALAYRHLAPAVFVSGVDVLDRCREIRCETTVMVGERDLPFVGPSLRLASAVPEARLVTIAGAYHSPQLTHPWAWIEAVRSHLIRTG